MSNLRPLVRSALNNFITSQDGYHSKVDVLRVIEEEAMLMKETQYTIDMLDSDPMEQLSSVKNQIDRLKRLIQVRSCTRTRTTNDYCKIDAVVTFEKCNNLQLTFRYERKRRQEEDGRISKAGFHIRYSIEMSVNHRQRENLIVVEVWTANNWPSIEKAVCINKMMEGGDENENENDDEEWEDIEEGDDGTVAIEESTIKNNSPQKQGTIAKRQKLNDSQETNSSENNHLPKDGDTDDDSDEPDSYLAHLDPDVLHEFLELAGLQSKRDEMHDGVAFFMMMTFPFYEQEWDLVGYLIEEIFGDDEEE